MNESLEHQVGDQLLVAIASRLEAVSRADATVARIGGDEFVVLAEGLSGPAEVDRIGRRLLDALRKPYPLSPADPVTATVSIGIAIASTPDRSPGEVYREADLALDRAKEGGGDQYALFDEELRAGVVARAAAEQLLRRATADDLVVVHYQPVIGLAHGDLVGVEALARVGDPVRGVVPPDEFIEVAGESALIVDVDLRMFELAVGDLARWRRGGLERVGQLAVNMSARTLADPGSVARLVAVLNWYGVAPGDIRIELTERSLLDATQTVHDSLARLNELGIHLGLDDLPAEAPDPLPEDRSPRRGRAGRGRATRCSGAGDC